jgi:hypothetical protein
MLINNNGEGFLAEAVIDGVSSDQFPDPRVQRLSRKKNYQVQLGLAI